MALHVFSLFWLLANFAEGRFLDMRAAEEVEGPLPYRRMLSGLQASSEDSLIESAAFVVGMSVGTSGVLLILITIALCFFCYKRKRHNTLVFEKPLVMDSLELTASLQKQRRSSDGRVSFVRSSLRDDATLRPIEDLELEKIEFSANLGRGAFGKVYRGEYAGIPLAIKVLEHDGTGLSHGDEPLETYLSRNTDHPNVVKTFVNETRRCQSFAASMTITSVLKTPSAAPSNSIITEQRESSSRNSDDEFSYMARAMGTTEMEDHYRTWIVMEFCDKGSLDQAIKNKIFFLDGYTHQPKIRLMLLTALDIASAMTYLHNESIVHGDLKSQNVLLSQSDVDERGFICKVGDFGLSRVIINKTHIDTFTHGTVSHSAPELFRQGLLTPAADVYSFGILLWELFTGEKAYTRTQHSGIIMAVTRGFRPVVPLHCPAPLANLITDCWRDVHFDRPSFRSIVERLIPMIRDCTSLEFKAADTEPNSHRNNFPPDDDLSLDGNMESKDLTPKCTISQSPKSSYVKRIPQQPERRIEALSISTEKRSLEIAAAKRRLDGAGIADTKTSEEETETESEGLTTPESIREHVLRQ